MGTSTLRRLSLLLAMLALGSAACGETSEGNIVYLHIINAYEGGGDLSVYGPDGDLITGLESGTQSNGGIPFDRTQFNENLNFALQGVPGLVPIPLDLYALYPGEHATLLVQRRASLVELDVSLLRHNLSTYDLDAPSAFKCSAEFTNAMSLSNEFSDSRFEFAMELKVPKSIVDANYNRVADESALTECGSIEIASLTGGSEINTQRQNEYVEIDRSPWFFLVTSPEDGDIGLVPRKGLYVAAGGEVQGVSGTEEYRRCVAGAIELGESSDMNDTCGPGAVEGAKLDPIAAQDCLNPVSYQTPAVTPGPQQSTILFYNTVEDNCNVEMRVRTHSVDSVFASDKKIKGVNIEGSIGQWQHIVVWGRPINPNTFVFSGDDEGFGYTSSEQ